MIVPQSVNAQSDFSPLSRTGSGGTMVSGDRSNKITITFKKDRCLYARSTWTSCSLCVDSCPSGAISMDGKKRLPGVDLGRCMQCGQCLSACPLEAFESSSFSERQLLSRIEPEKDIRLHCFVPRGEYASLAAGVSTYQLGTCLAALTPGAFVELSLNRMCELSTDQCSQCALFSSLGQTLECNIGLAHYLLIDWGKEKNLKETTALFLAQQEEVDHWNKVSVNEKPDTGITGSYAMRQSIRSLFHGRKRKPQNGKRQLPLRAKSRHVPTWRIRLKSLWEEVSEERGSTSCPWPELVVDENKCRACGICMQLCPTGSISHYLGEGLFTYSFTPGTCVNCGLCIVSCATEALSRDYGSFLHPFEEREESVRPALSCSRCGLPVLDGVEGQRCYLCLSEPDPRPFIERVKKQLSGITKAERARGGTVKK